MFKFLLILMVSFIVFVIHHGIGFTLFLFLILVNFRKYYGTNTNIELIDKSEDVGDSPYSATYFDFKDK